MTYTAEEWEEIVEDTYRHMREMSSCPPVMEDYEHGYMTGMYMIGLLLQEIREELWYA